HGRRGAYAPATRKERRTPSEDCPRPRAPERRGPPRRPPGRRAAPPRRAFLRPSRRSRTSEWRMRVRALSPPWRVLARRARAFGGGGRGTSRIVPGDPDPPDAPRRRSRRTEIG